MSNYNNYYVDKNTKFPKTAKQLKQLIQCLRIVWDGDLISKPERDWLVGNGLIARCDGFNIITKEGIKYLQQYKLLKP